MIQKLRKKIPKIFKFLEFIGIGYIYHKSKKLKDILNIPKYICYLGMKQCLKLISISLKRERKIIKLNVKYLKHPIHLRTLTTDFSALKLLIIEKELDINYYNIKPKYTIDGGGNCGLATVFLANKFPNAKIVCIEPNKKNVLMIKKNIEKYKNCHLIEGALWSETSHLKIIKEKRIKENNFWSFRVEKSNKKESEFMGYSLDDIMKKYKLKTLDILKLDIEGSEKELFEKNYKIWLSKTKMSIIEVHERYAPGVTKLLNERIKEYKFKTTKTKEKLIIYKNEN